MDCARRSLTDRLEQVWYGFVAHQTRGQSCIDCRARTEIVIGWTERWLGKTEEAFGLLLLCIFFWVYRLKDIGCRQYEARYYILHVLSGSIQAVDIEETATHGRSTDVEDGLCKPEPRLGCRQSKNHVTRPRPSCLTEAAGDGALNTRPGNPRDAT